MVTRVKICGLTRLEDAEKALELGADAFGVIFEPSSPRFALDHLEALNIPALVGPYGTTVAVYGEYNASPVDLDFGLVQCIAGDAAARPHVRVFRFPASTAPDAAFQAIDEVQGNPKAILIDSYSPDALGGTGHRADWALAAAIVSRFPSRKAVLAGGLTPDNVGEAIRQVRPYAVDVSSGIESSPGIKDHAMMRDFIQAARQA